MFTKKIIFSNLTALKMQFKFKFHRFSKTTVLQSLMSLVFIDIEAEFNDNSMRGLPIPSLLKLLLYH